MTTPTRFEVGQRWRWTRGDVGRGVKAGDLFVVAKVDDAGDAFDGLICCSRARITAGGHPWSGSLEYLGMASGEGEGPRMGEVTVNGIEYPASCLWCGGDRGDRGLACDPCWVANNGVGDMWTAWKAGDRRFPRKPKAAPVVAGSYTGTAAPPSTVAPPGSRWRHKECGCVLVASTVTDSIGGSVFALPVRPAPKCSNGGHWAIDPARFTRLPDEAAVPPAAPPPIYDPSSTRPGPTPKPIRIEVASLVDRVAEDRRIATLMRMEGRTTDPGPAVAALPVPAWAGIDEWDLLPDADEPICPPRVRGLRKPGALR